MLKICGAAWLFIYTITSLAYDLHDTRLDKPVWMVLENEHDLQAYRFQSDQATMMWRKSFASQLSNAVIVGKGHARLPGVDNTIVKRPWVKSESVYVINGDKLLGFKLNSGESLFELNFQENPEKRICSTILTTGSIFENNHLRELVSGVTCSGTLFVVDVTSKPKLLWMKSIPERTMVHSPQVMRFRGQQWMLVYVLNSDSLGWQEIFFANVFDGKEVFHLRIPTELKKLHAHDEIHLVGVDTKQHGFVDSLYLASSGSLWKVNTESEMPYQWYIYGLPLFRQEAIIGKPQITRGRGLNEVLFTHTLYQRDGSGSSLVQWLYDAHHCTYPINLKSQNSCLKWQYHTKSIIQTPKWRQNALVFTEYAEGYWTSKCLEGRTGKVMHLAPVRTFIPSVKVGVQLSSSLSILLRQPREKENVIITQAPTGKMGWSTLEIDYQNLGRRAWNQES